MTTTRGCEVRRRTLFDSADSPDGLLEGERRERLVLLTAELMRQASSGTLGGKGTRDE